MEIGPSQAVSAEHMHDDVTRQIVCHRRLHSECGLRGRAAFCHYGTPRARQRVGGNLPTNFDELLVNPAIPTLARQRVSSTMAGSCTSSLGTAPSRSL